MNRRTMLSGMAALTAAACTSAADRDPAAYPASDADPLASMRLYSDSGADRWFRHLPTPLSDDGPNVLALSGGGEDGAFGAGALVGLTDSGHRPDFDIVTGISTGR